MPVFLQVGQVGTLRFLPSQAGLDPALVASASWQPQGSQQHVRFTPPDQVEGISAGTADYKVTVTMTTPGEKVTYAFTATCNPAGPPAPPKMDPVAIDITVTPP
jgi:hypothetical protein